MKLKSLKLENFRQHEDSYLEFNDGITIINGPNGSGKSTVLEAISWAIYGTEAARGNKDSIKFNRAKPRTKVRVELVFELDKNVFRVVRYLGKAEVYLGENEAPVATSQQEVTGYLIEKIGMTRNEFFNTYFTGQKELNFLKNQGPIDRKKFISRVLNYDKIKEAQEAARVDKNNLDREIAGIKLGLADMDNLSEEKAKISTILAKIRYNLGEKQKHFCSISDELAKIEPEWEKIKTVKENFDKLSSENKFLLDKKNYLEENIQNLSNQIKILEEKNQKLSDLMKIEEEYRNLEKKIKELESLQEKDALRQKYSIRVENLEKEISEKQLQLEEIVKSGKEKKEKIDKLPAINEEINNLNEEIQKLESELSSQKKEKEVLIQQKHTEIQKINKQLALIKEKGENGVCPTCERPLKDEFDKVTGNFNDQIENLSAEISKIQADLEKISEKPIEIKKLKEQKQQKEKEAREFILVQGGYDQERERYKIVKTELDFCLKELEKLKPKLAEIPEGFNMEILKQLRQEIAPIKEQYEEIISLKAEISSLDRIKNNYKEVCKAKDDVENRKNSINEDLNGLNYSEDKYKKIEQNYFQTKELFHNSREELVKIEAEEKSISKDLEHIRKVEESNREKSELVKQKQEEFNLLCELDRFYNQLWEKLNNYARPEISELAGKFLSDLTDNRYSMLELNDKYEICLHDDGEIKSVISGGEEDIVNLCIRLAISQIIAQRSGKALSLLIMDEIFGSLDENRRANVINLLRNLTGSFEQVILITHIDDIKYDIDNLINIEFDPETGSSIITKLSSGNRVPEFV